MSSQICIQGLPTEIICDIFEKFEQGIEAWAEAGQGSESLKALRLVSKRIGDIATQQLCKNFSLWITRTSWKEMEILVNYSAFLDRLRTLRLKNVAGPTTLATSHHHITDRKLNLALVPNLQKIETKTWQMQKVRNVQSAPEHQYRCLDLHLLSAQNNDLWY